MRHGLGRLILAPAAIGAMLLTVSPAFAQPPAEGRGGRGGGRGAFGRGRGPQLPPPGPVPRTADGHPDMSGYWNATNNGGAVFEVQKHTARSRSLPAGNGAIVDPADGLIPYQPWAAEKARDNFDHHLAEEPELHCYESGVPKSTYVQFGFEILQPANYMVMNWEFMHAYRIVPTDNRQHVLPASTKLFMGDSVGHWEGDTLVVDTTNLNDRTWFDTAGNFHSDQEHVIEKFTMVNDRTINYEATVEDPKVLTKPFTIKMDLARMQQKNYEIMEFGCIEGNQDAQHYTTAEGGKEAAK